VTVKTIHNDALCKLLQQILSEPYLDQLRTKETLGYNVGLLERCWIATCGLKIYVQGEHHPCFVEGRINNFIATAEVSNYSYKMISYKCVSCLYVHYGFTTILVENYWRLVRRTICQAQESCGYKSIGKTQKLLWKSVWNLGRNFKGNLQLPLKRKTNSRVRKDNARRSFILLPSKNKSQLFSVLHELFNLNISLQKMIQKPTSRRLDIHILSLAESGAGKKRWNEPESQQDSNRIKIMNVQAWKEQQNLIDRPQSLFKFDN